MDLLHTKLSHALLCTPSANSSSVILLFRVQPARTLELCSYYLNWRFFSNAGSIALPKPMRFKIYGLFPILCVSENRNVSFGPWGSAGTTEQVRYSLVLGKNPLQGSSDPEHQLQKGCQAFEILTPSLFACFLCICVGLRLSLYIRS